MMTEKKIMKGFEGNPEIVQVFPDNSDIWS